MTTPTDIIPCRGVNCEKKLRVPSDRGRLKVTCPDCGTAWEWAPTDLRAEAAAPPSTPFRVHPVVMAAAALLVVCGVWNRAWAPTSLFVLAAVAWWVCRRKASAGPEQTLLQKGSGALWEATAGVAGAAAVGFGAVVGLITFLNGYARLIPSRYPTWLPALEDGLFGMSAWLQNSDNKTLIAVTYIVLILLGIGAAAWARRRDRQLMPVKRLSTWKQRVTKAAVALQAFTLFTFFSQTPINVHALELEQQLRWRYGVAKRAEQDLNNKQLLAEQLTAAARAPERRQEDRDDFAALIDELRSTYQRPAAPPATGGPNGPRPPGPNDFPPGGPSGWRPPSWPHPPGDVLKKIGGGEPLAPDDYRPRSSRTGPKAPDAPASDKTAPPKNVEAGGGDSWESKAEALVSSQVENTKPPAANDAPAPAPPNPAEGMAGPIKTVEQWEAAKEQVAAQEAKANGAERRYGQAVQGALEAVCEYIGLQVKTDPVVEAWIDLAINNLSDRAYQYLMPGEASALSGLKTHLRRLLSPKESAAEKLVAEARARIGAADYDGAERLAGDLLSKYPKTKASKQARALTEEASFQKTKLRYDDPNTSWDETIKSCTAYLDDHYDSSRSGRVRQWLTESKRQKAADELDARTPRMIVYVRDTCGNSQYFRQVTARNSLVRSAMNRFKYELRDIDSVSRVEQLRLDSVGEDTLPIILFENKAGSILNSIGGVRALEPSSLLAKMRVVR